MSATTWFIIAIVGFSLSGIALVAAVFMLIKMNIPAVIGDLTGKTVAREIQAMRDTNASSGNKLHRSSSVNANRGKLTEKAPNPDVDGSVKAVAHASKRLDKTNHSAHLKKEESAVGAPARVRTTESLSMNVGEVNIEERRATAILPQNRVTDMLEERRKTDLLVPETAVLPETHQTEVLLEIHQTEVLSQLQPTETMQSSAPRHEERAGTTVLSEVAELPAEEVRPVAFKVTKSVVMIHTDEVIE